MKIAGIILIIAGLVFILIYMWMRKFLEKTKNDWEQTTATIISYNVEDYSSRDTPIVQFCDDGREVMASASTVPHKGRPLIGETVHIEYRRNPARNGGHTYQVIISSDSGDSSNAVTIIMLVIGVVLTAAGCLFFFCNT